MESSMDYALNVLRKHKATLESNLKVIPAIQINVNMLPVYRKQLREIRKALQYLEKEEMKQVKEFDDT